MVYNSLASVYGECKHGLRFCPLAKLTSKHDLSCLLVLRDADLDDVSSATCVVQSGFLQWVSLSTMSDLIVAQSLK